MKKLIFIFYFFLMYNVKAQQGGSLSPLLPNDASKFTLYGIGSLNSESFNNVNGSGKLSGLATLHRTNGNKLSIFLSANRNASNNDSTLASTLLFPEVGKAAFIGTLHWMWALDKPNAGASNFVGGFAQGSFKDIKGERNIKATGRDTTATFSIIDWQFGLRYIKNVFKDTDTKALFSASLFLDYYNVPDEDNEDYRLIFDEPKMASGFWSWGVKLMLEVNRLQLFGDFRQVLGSEEKIPIRDLRGFSLNVGVVFNADFVEK